MNERDGQGNPRPNRRETLLEKKAAIDAQLARLNSVEAAAKRKLDTRRKILVGSVMLAEAERHPKVGEWLQAQLSRSLKQPRDRAVFDLPPLPASDAGNKADQNSSMVDTDKPI